MALACALGSSVAGLTQLLVSFLAEMTGDCCLFRYHDNRRSADVSVPYSTQVNSVPLAMSGFRVETAHGEKRPRSVHLWHNDAILKRQIIVSIALKLSVFAGELYENGCHSPLAYWVSPQRPA